MSALLRSRSHLCARNAPTHYRLGAKGYTPLHYTAHYNKPAVAERLMHHGANLNGKTQACTTTLKPSERRSPIDLARHHFHTELATRLATAHDRATFEEKFSGFCL